MTDGKQSTRYSLSWEAFHQDVDHLLQKLLPLGPWGRLLVVTRGGLAPAAYLSQHLAIRLVETVCVASYFEEGQQSTLQLLKPPLESCEKTLVIDDLVDSGKTITLLRKILPKAQYAAVYAKPAGRPQVDVFARPLDQETWVVFPWEERPAEEGSL